MRTHPVLSLSPGARTGIFLVILILAGFLVVFSGSHLLSILFAGSNCGERSKSRIATGEHAIALIDQLGMEYPNPTFAANVSSTAKSAGYGFQYYPPENVTLDFFVNLPTYNYSIIILRTHGTGVVATDPGAIVTSENYSQSQHVVYQLTDKVTAVEVGGTLHFALGSSFVSSVMCGRFSGTLVLALYCERGESSSLAKAFLEKGAGGYIGWDYLVTVSHTDSAFESIVKLLVEGNSADRSVQDTMRTLGPDPVWGARLVNYSQNSFPTEVTPWWEQYWYVISAGIAVAIVGLARVRKTLR